MADTEEQVNAVEEKEEEKTAEEPAAEEAAAEEEKPAEEGEAAAEETPAEEEAAATEEQAEEEKPADEEPAAEEQTEEPAATEEQAAEEQAEEPAAAEEKAEEPAATEEAAEETAAQEETPAEEPAAEEQAAEETPAEEEPAATEEAATEEAATEEAATEEAAAEEAPAEESSAPLEPEQVEQIVEDLTEEQKEKLQEVFTLYAVDERIDYANYKKLMRYMGVHGTEAEFKAWYTSADTNGDKIDFAEFCKLYLAHKKPEDIMQDELTKCVDKLFGSKDKVSLGEVAKILSSLERQPSDIDEETLHSYCKSMDTNGDGLVDKLEFVKSLCGGKM